MAGRRLPNSSCFGSRPLSGGSENRHRLWRRSFGIFCAMDPKIKEYMSKNGAKGGHAGKGTELRKKLNQAAAQARWAKARPKAKAANASNTP
jgi:hypothetical protein